MIDWERVDRLIERAPNLDALRSHRLHLLAARRRQQDGEGDRPTLAAAERAAAIAVLTAPLALRRAVESYDRPILLMKGLEVAMRYPDPALRPFGDIDLLVGDAPAAQRALLEAGFHEVGNPAEFENIHHLRPLAAPRFPLSIELHSEPKSPLPLAAGTATEEIVAAAVPSATGVEGLLAPAPAHHTVILAAHSWAHEPLRRIGELLDMQLMREAAEDADVLAIARRWGLERVVKASFHAADALFDGAPRPVPMRVWARHLPRAAERTVSQSHLTKWFAPFSALPPPAATRRAARAVAADARPAAGESWRSKIGRALSSIRNAARPRSTHEAEIGAAAHVGNPFWTPPRSESETLDG
jgi:hypothetical protein